MSAKFPRGGGSKPILSHPSNVAAHYVGTELTSQLILVTQMANLVLGACMNIVALSISSHEQTEKTEFSVFEYCRFP